MLARNMLLVPVRAGGPAQELTPATISFGRAEGVSHSDAPSVCYIAYYSGVTCELLPALACPPSGSSSGAMRRRSVYVFPLAQRLPSAVLCPSLFSASAIRAIGNPSARSSRARTAAGSVARVRCTAPSCTPAARAAASPSRVRLLIRSLSTHAIASMNGSDS